MGVNLALLDEEDACDDIEDLMIPLKSKLRPSPID